MAKRNWDIELINDPEEIQKRIARAPQLCMVLNKDIPPAMLYNIVTDHKVFSIPIDGEDRCILLAGAYTYAGEFKQSPEQVERTFGRQVKEQIFDDLIQIGNTPYFPFCEDADTAVIQKLGDVFDIQEVEHNKRKHTAIRGHYYFESFVEAQESRVVAQLPPIYN